MSVIKVSSFPLMLVLTLRRPFSKKIGMIKSLIAKLTIGWKNSFTRIWIGTLRKLVNHPII